MKENKPARNAKESKTERMRAFLNDETLFSDYSVGEYETKRSRVLNSLSEIYPNDLYVKTCDMDSGANYERPASEGENVYNSLHYVIRGKGVFECNGVKYNIEKDTLFIVPADVESKYFSDSANPWTYIYIDIGGVLQQSIIRQLGFDSKRRIARFKPDNEVGKKFMEVYESVMDTDPWSLKTTAALYGLLYEIKRLRLKKIPYDSKNRYIRQAMGVIRNNISYVTVAGIEINSEPTQKEYEIGDEFSTAGLTLKVNYVDGTSEIVYDGYVVKGGTFDKAGKATVTIEYGGKSLEIEVEVVSDEPTPPAPEPDKPDDEKKGCGASAFDSFSIAFGVGAIAIAAAFVFVKNKKRKD